ncbi:unnamed protein product [Echinostoma caproni]|uniref:Col_cuticle_N domain-containing protein n=1 Tax=Echinostoma caproni TaxID=27848 RepID=A0A183ARK8_9TREM|nr:unnamed protein product [Echinostoma caproni]
MRGPHLSTMNSDLTLEVDQPNPNSFSSNVKLRTFLIVNILIVSLCGLSTVLSLISILAKEAWISEEFRTSIQIQEDIEQCLATEMRKHISEHLGVRGEKLPFIAIE